VNAQDANGRHAIHYAAQRFHPSTLKALKIAEIILNETKNQALNIRDKRGTSPLMQACQKVMITSHLHCSSITFCKGHIESLDMLIDRAKNAGVLNVVLEAKDNRCLHVHFSSSLPISTTSNIVLWHRGYNILHHAAENLLSSVIRHLLSSYPQLTRIVNSRTTPLGRTDRYYRARCNSCLFLCLGRTQLHYTLR
jgi:hypothetical protein